MTSAVMLTSLIRDASRVLDRPPFDLTYVLEHAVDRGFLAASEDDRTDAEIDRLREWVHGFVEIHQADLSKLFSILSGKLAFARVLLDLPEGLTVGRIEERYRNALANLDLVEVARGRLVLLLRQQTG